MKIMPDETPEEFISRLESHAEFDEVINVLREAYAEIDRLRALSDLRTIFDGSKPTPAEVFGEDDG